MCSRVTASAAVGIPRPARKAQRLIKSVEVRLDGSWRLVARPQARSKERRYAVRYRLHLCWSEACRLRVLFGQVRCARPANMRDLPEDAGQTTYLCRGVAQW
jgi:hypothetical protein